MVVLFHCHSGGHVAGVAGLTEDETRNPRRYKDSGRELKLNDNGESNVSKCKVRLRVCG